MSFFDAPEAKRWGEKNDNLVGEASDPWCCLIEKEYSYHYAGFKWDAFE
jgi:hypothetical protein